MRYKIEKGLTMPPAIGWKKAEQEFFDTLLNCEVGDSILVHDRAFVTVAKGWLKNINMRSNHEDHSGRVYEATEEDGKARVWRIK